MPNGYLCTLGDASLDVNDTIDATQVFFTIGATIGAGGWNWPGVWAGNGTFYSNINDTGTYYEGTDGNVYFIPTNWFTTSGTAYVTSAPAFTLSTIVNGTSGADVIDASYTESDGEQVDASDGTGPSGNEDTISAGDGADTIRGDGGNDQIDGGQGNDTIAGDAGADTIRGGAGNDSIDENAGNDLIGAGPASDTTTLDWAHLTKTVVSPSLAQAKQ